MKWGTGAEQLCPAGSGQVDYHTSRSQGFPVLFGDSFAWNDIFTTTRDTKHLVSDPTSATDIQQCNSAHE